MAEGARVEIHLKVDPGVKVTAAKLEKIVKDYADGIKPPAGVKIELVEWHNHETGRSGRAKKESDVKRLGRLIHGGRISVSAVREG